MKKSLLTVAATLLLLQTPLIAFHEQGSADCEACHVSHDSQDGQVLPGPTSKNWLLRAETSSDLCLSCHAEDFGAVLGMDPLHPPPERAAGNFVFLVEDNLDDTAVVAGNIPGDAAGHNLDAPGYGLFPDAYTMQAPGGSFNARDMRCTSCHDPHGNGNFRLLRGIGDVPTSPGFSYYFSNPAPQAEGLRLDGSESPSSHTAYLSGMSEWCANCHGRYRHGGASGMDGFRHNSGIAMGSNTATHYNHYDGQDRWIAGQLGSPATSFIPEVPFEDSGMTTSSTSGPSAGSRLMCLSCHRAHASSAPHAGRWDFNVDLLEDDGRPSGSYPIPSPYPGQAQGTLCYKCHETIPGPAEEPLSSRPGLNRPW